MWTEAAKWLNKFEEAVLTLTDRDGYPVSVRVVTRTYDAATGELSLPAQEYLRAVEGPATCCVIRTMRSSGTFNC